jgi:hypothetical protein
VERETTLCKPPPNNHCSSYEPSQIHGCAIEHLTREAQKELFVDSPAWKGDRMYKAVPSTSDCITAVTAEPRAAAEIEPRHDRFDFGGFRA